MNKHYTRKQLIIITYNYSAHMHFMTNTGPFCLVTRLSFENKQFSGSLWELANRFVGVDLNISKDHPNLMHPKFLLQKSMDYTNKLSNSEQLLTYCTSQLNNVQSETIMVSVSIVLLYFYQNFNTFTEFLH